LTPIRKQFTIKAQTQQTFTHYIQRESKMNKQPGASTTPAFPTQAGKKANIGVAAEENTPNESMEKLQQVCQKTMAAVQAATAVVQNEVVQWTAKVGEWSKQEVSGAEIVSQTDSRIGEGLEQVRQIIARVRNRSQSLQGDIVSWTETSSINVKDLVEAIAGMENVMTQVDYRQAKAEAKQVAEMAKKAKTVAADTEAKETAARIQFGSGPAVTEAKKKANEAREAAGEKAKEAEQANAVVEQAKAVLGKEPVGATKKMRNAILATVEKLQAVVAELKRVYLQQMEAMMTEAEATQKEAKKWVAAEVKNALQIEKWYKQMDFIYRSIGKMLEQKVVQAIIQDTAKAIIDHRLSEVERSLAQIRTIYQTEMVPMKAALEAEKTKKEAQKTEITIKDDITVKIRAKMGEMLYVVNKGSSMISVIATATNEVIEMIRVGTSPQRVVITPDRTKLLITNAGDNTVSILDTATHQIIAAVPVGNHPLGIAILPDGTQAYVTNYGSGTVSVLDLQMNPVTAKEIRVGDSPVGVAFVYGGTRVFVTNALSRTISVIDKATQKVMREIQLEGRSPQGVAVTPDGKKAYIADEESDTITVINVVNNKITARIQVGQGPTEVAITADGTRAYVANSRGDNVSVVDVTTNPPTLVTTIAVGDRPVGIAFSGNGMRAYVSNENDDNVSVIDTATFTVQDPILVGQNPAGMAIGTETIAEKNVRKVTEAVMERNRTEFLSRKVRAAYVTNWSSNNVSVIDTNTYQVVATISVGKHPIDVAITQDGARACVVNHGSDNVSLIDTATYKVVATISVGKKPVNVATVPHKTQVYVMNHGSANVSVIDIVIQKVVATISVGKWLSGVAITPAGIQDYVIGYVTSMGNAANVNIIDNDTKQILDTVPTGQELWKYVALAPGGTRAYMVKDISYDICVIDTATQNVLMTIPVGVLPRGTTFTPDATRICVAEDFEGSITVGDTAPIRESAPIRKLATISVGKRPVGVAITPDGTKGYVPNMGGNNVSVIDIVTYQVLTTIPVGEGPVFVAIASIPQ
jgi:YVTN family beta-propeller protein